MRQDETPKLDLRRRVLDSLGAGASESEELLAYNANRFDWSALKPPVTLPLPDEPFVAVWERYQGESVTRTLVDVLREKLVQFGFPIERGISATAAYQAATRRGLLPGGAGALEIRNPTALSLVLHPGPAGRLPALVTTERADFRTLLRAMAWRNEPADIPDSMGSQMIVGYNNWDRIHALRRAWEAEHPKDGSGWEAEFASIIPRKELYQDSFMLLCQGPYSGVAAGDLGLDADRWLQASMTIRLEHESTHYFTRRVFGSMQNRLMDELMADYMGIGAVQGTFRADWFLRFMGLESYPRYRPGGRLENYRGATPLSEGAFRLLQPLVHAAVRNLEEFDSMMARQVPGPERRVYTVIGLSTLTLEELAASDASGLLANGYSAARGCFVRTGSSLHA